MEEAFYLALLGKDKNRDETKPIVIGVIFPDLPGCVSAGDSMTLAKANADVTLSLAFDTIKEMGGEVPKGQTYEEARKSIKDRLPEFLQCAEENYEILMVVSAKYTPGLADA